MKLSIISTANKQTGQVDLPKQFSEPVRVDLIKRAVLAKQSRDRQPYGADPKAGKRASAFVSKRRNNYKTTYGIGQSRTPRKVMSFRGTRFNWTGAFAPQTVGGRRAHPPKASKQWNQKINKKERRKAIRSALAATIDKNLVSERGHLIPDNYPFIIENKFEEISRTKELKIALKTINVDKDLERAEQRKIRPGKGTMRGRKYRTKKSMLLVVSKDCSLIKSASNLPGVDIVLVENLNAELLAPGTMPGRMTLFTEESIKKIGSESLFENDGTTVPKKPAQKKVAAKPVVKAKPAPIKTTEPKSAVTKPVVKAPVEQEKKAEVKA